MRTTQISFERHLKERQEKKEKHMSSVKFAQAKELARRTGLPLILREADLAAMLRLHDCARPDLSMVPQVR